MRRQLADRREELALGQVTGRTEDHQRASGRPTRRVTFHTGTVPYNPS
jgi:hypothetical protein